MEIKFKVTDENDKYYGTYSKLEHAIEYAEIEAEDEGKDMFIYKITTELVDCVVS